MGQRVGVAEENVGLGVVTRKVVTQRRKIAILYRVGGVDLRVLLKPCGRSQQVATRCLVRTGTRQLEFKPVISGFHSSASAHSLASSVTAEEFVKPGLDAGRKRDIHAGDIGHRMLLFVQPAERIVRSAKRPQKEEVVAFDRYLA